MHGRALVELSFFIDWLQRFGQQFYQNCRLLVLVSDRSFDEDNEMTFLEGVNNLTLNNI